MAKWGMVINISKCVACYTCFVACKDEYWDNDYPPYTVTQPRHGQFWMSLVKKERGKYPWVKVAHMPLPCMQCDQAPCIEAAKDGAVYKRNDGIVVIDPQKAIGQKQIVKSCPYNVIFWNQEKKLPQKCTFCAHRLAEGKTPRCVQSCPSEAIKFGDLDDPNSAVSQLLKCGKAEVFHPEYNAKSRVYYLDLHKITKCFIAGAVVLGDVNECAEDVTVTLKNKNGKTLETKTNNYGNFEFDGLDAGKYSVKLECKGYTAKAIDVDLKTDNYLGDIILDKV